MNEKELEKKFSNLETKIAQNRGYTTELKEEWWKSHYNFTVVRLNKTDKILQKVINALRITEFGLSNAYGKELLDILNSGKKDIHIISEGEGQIEWIKETKDSIIVKYNFNKKPIKYPKLK